MSHWTNNVSNKIFLSYILKKKKNSNKLNFIPDVASLTSYISPSKTRSVYDWNVDGLTCIVYGLTREGPSNAPQEEDDAKNIYSRSSELQRSALLQMNILYWLNILQSAANCVNLPKWHSISVHCKIPVFSVIFKLICSLKKGKGIKTDSLLNNLNKWVCRFWWKT